MAEECKTPATQPPEAVAGLEMGGPLVSPSPFPLPVYSHWSYADSFEYLVGVSATAAAHSLLQLLISVSRLRKKAVVIPSQKYAWIMYAGDQIFAYAMMSAGSAASGVTSLNRTGIKHTALPNFCKPLHTFCNRVAASIVFTFLSCFFLAASAVLDVIWLTCY
ncbi:CASP-like protein 3A1 isoform X2 [Spinacia oleracea]|uniref:CASP-like protein n=1 Tax=Spinacia oleracea TaxID=3562 RepID=A0ABM3RUF4_SPIOL|nr:CASP-like protein 3A1 isoform X2 [Spinacia oleracea]